MFGRDSGGKWQIVLGVWPVVLRASLECYVDARAERARQAPSLNFQWEPRGGTSPDQCPDLCG